MFPFFLLLSGSSESSFLPSFGNLLDCVLPLLLDVCDHSDLDSVLIQAPGFNYYTDTHLSLTPASIFFPEIQTRICSHLWEFLFGCTTDLSNSSQKLNSFCPLHICSPYLSEEHSISHSFPFTQHSYPVDQQVLSILPSTLSCSISFFPPVPTAALLVQTTITYLLRHPQ